MLAGTFVRRTLLASSRGLAPAQGFTVAWRQAGAGPFWTCQVRNRGREPSASCLCPPQQVSKGAFWSLEFGISSFSVGYRSWKILIWQTTESLGGAKMWDMYPSQTFSKCTQIKTHKMSFCEPNSWENMTNQYTCNYLGAEEVSSFYLTRALRFNSLSFKRSWAHWDAVHDFWLNKYTWYMLLQYYTIVHCVSYLLFTCCLFLLSCL